MINLLSYCRLVYAKIRASDKDLPVKVLHWRMVVKNAGANAMGKMESVTGVARKVGAVGKIRLQMDVMVLLEEMVSTMNAIFTQVCM